MTVQDPRKYRRGGHGRVFIRAENFIIRLLLLLCFPLSLKIATNRGNSISKLQISRGSRDFEIRAACYWESRIVPEQASLRSIHGTRRRTCVRNVWSKIKASTRSACLSYSPSHRKSRVTLYVSYIVESAAPSEKSYTIFISQASIRLTGSTINLYKNNSYPT